MKSCYGFAKNETGPFSFTTKFLDSWIRSRGETVFFFTLAKHLVQNTDKYYKNVRQIF